MKPETPAAQAGQMTHPTDATAALLAEAINIALTTCGIDMNDQIRAWATKAERALAPAAVVPVVEDAREPEACDVRDTTLDAPLPVYYTDPFFDVPSEVMTLEGEARRRSATPAQPVAAPSAPVQAPVFWYRKCSDDGLYEGPIHNASIEDVRKQSGAWTPLYEGATPQPSAQEAPREAVSDEQIDALLDKAGFKFRESLNESKYLDSHPYSKESFRAFARAILATVGREEQR